MVRVLHLYPHDDDLLAQYVGMVERVTGAYDGTEPELVHVHGCWHHDIIRQARRYGVRTVLSPHGQLQPWVVEQETLAKAKAWQRHFTEHCYAVVAHGPMEVGNLQSLGWNPRIETVRNPIVTATISEEEACRQLTAIYQKVMDSNVRELMTPETRCLLACLLKAGITGDRRWVQPSALAQAQTAASGSQAPWRQLFIYARQEHVDEVLRRGISVMGLEALTTDDVQTDSYLPADYEPTPQTLTDAVAIIQALHRRPTIKLLCDLHRALHADDTGDDTLADALRQKGLLKFGRRLMAVMAELTLLDEGFMPFTPLDDKQTNEIKTTIAENLKI